MKIVPLTRQYLEDCAPDGTDVPRLTVRGKAVLNDEGKAIGCCGGYVHGGAHVAFLHANDELRKSPRILVRLCKEVAKMPHRVMYAYCDDSFRGAERFLRRFGFEDRGDGIFVLEN